MSESTLTTLVLRSQSIYLASPYSSPDRDIEEGRFKAVCMAAGRLIKCGYRIYSPIVHTSSRRVMSWWPPTTPLA